tara:strand:+ start:106 stop:240 length:135 start_codon:yes stop_codon:yes gene_type:complete
MLREELTRKPNKLPQMPNQLRISQEKSRLRILSIRRERLRAMKI